MIGFLQPLLWLVGLAAALPVILHLIRRREVRRVVFPAVRYLRQAEKRHKRRLRLRHLLLLATRVVLILLLAAAAAGPLIGRGGAADHRPTALAILIDDSQSSTRLRGDRRLWDEYRDRVIQTLELASGADRVALFSTVGGERSLVVQGAGPIREQLPNLEPAAAAADLESALARARAWLRADPDDRAREVHLLTDLQRSSLPAAGLEEGADDGTGRGISIVVQAPETDDDGGDPGNGLPGVPAPEALPLTVGRATPVSVPLRWFGPELPEAPVIVRLVVDGRVVAVGEGRFESPALLQLPAPDSGWVQGYVEIEGHGLAADDRRYFTWPARPPTRVTLIGPRGSFVDEAIGALARGGRLQRTEPERAQVWVVGDGERLSDALGAAGGVLVLPPADPLDLARLNLRLERAGLPWRYEAEGRGAPGSTRLGEGSNVPGLPGTEVHRAYRLRPEAGPAGDTTLLRLEDGTPWLVRGTSRRGSAYLLLASPLNPEATELPVQAAMLPFLDAVLSEWARGGTIARRTIHGGEAFRLPPAARSAVGPNGPRRPVEGGAWLDARRAGNVAVLDADEHVIAAFSVVAPVLEGDLQRASRARLEALMPAAGWTWADPGPGGWSSAVYRARRGRHVWRPLVALVMVFAILEASLAAAGRRRRREPTPRRSPLDEA